MAGNIKGICIEFRGETTKLDKAMRQIRGESKDLDKELKAVNNALKFNPKNTELLAQKQQILREKIQKTGEELELLKKAQAEMDAQGVDKTSAEYRDLQRRIIEAESKQKHLNAQLAEMERVPSKIEKMSAAMKDFGSKAEKAGQALKPVSAAAAGIDAALGALAYKGGSAADELNTLAQVSGIGTEELQKYALAADLVDVSVDAIAKSQIKMKNSMQSAASGTGAQAEAFDALGVSVVDAEGHLRNQDEVFTEVIAALGQMENETERDAYAMDIFGKSASQLNPLIEDNGETYKRVADIFAQNNLSVVDQETLDRANEFNDQIDTLKATGTLAIQTLGMNLAGYLLPIMERVTEAANRFFGWLSSLSPQTLAVIGAVAGLVAALAPALIIIGKLATAIGAIMAYGPAIIGALGGILSAIGPVILIIGALVAAGVLLYKNWDVIKAKAIAFKDKVVATWEAMKSKTASAFNAIRDRIVTPIQNAFNTVKGWIQKLKNLFPLNVGKIFSNLKIPHINVSGGKAPFGIGGMGVKPSISVDWYDKGGIFRSPSIIGVGERRPEFVGALDDLRQIVRDETGGGGVTINVYGGNASAADIAAEVERRLIAAQKRRRMAWQ